MGEKYWSHAMVHANATIQAWPSEGNDESVSPLEALTGVAPVYNNYKAWGSVGYVHEETRSGFMMKAVKTPLEL